MNTYTPTHWVNDSDPPVSAENLNKIEQGIVDAHEHVADKENPHEVTKEQIGAASADDFALHEADTENPHNVTHEQTEPVGAEPGEDETKDKHISDADYADIAEHLANEANPHDVTHEQTGPVGADLEGDDEVQDKHVSDADAARWEAHVQHESPHAEHETLEGAQAKVNAHAILTNNPHGVSAEQVGAPTTEDLMAHEMDETMHVTEEQKYALDGSFYPLAFENPVVSSIELQELLSGSVRASVATLAALAAITEDDRSNNDMRLVEESNIIYRFDFSATEGDVQPLDGEGYWFAVRTSTPSHNDLIGLQGGASDEYFHLSAQEREDTAEHLVDIENPHSVSAGQIGALVSINGVSHPGGDIEIKYIGVDLQVAIDTETFEISLINEHNERDDNPHDVTHIQTNPESADPESADTDRTKHISDNDLRVMENHYTMTNTHGATSELTPSRIIARDEEGRAKVSDPVDPSDIATKNYVDNVMAGGVAIFAGSGSEVQITHGLGRMPRTVQVTPMAATSAGTNDEVGEIWYRADDTTIWVGNTGVSTMMFGWFALA